MANGGLIAHSGAHNIAVAAKHYRVPFVVITGLHKLCPLYAFDQDTFNEHYAPSQVSHSEQTAEKRERERGFDKKERVYVSVV